MNIKLLSLLSLLFFTSCFSIGKNSSLKGNGSIVSKEVSISDYSKINGGGTVKIIYEQNEAKAPYLKYEIDENLVEYISFNTEEETLTIKSTKSLDTKNFKVYTNSKHLNAINLSGGSDIEIKSELNGDKLELKLSGASDAIANKKIVVNELSVGASGASDSKISLIEAKKISINTSGSSDMELAGSTDSLIISASGASDITADKLQSRIAKVKASGSSDVSLYVTEELDANGSGASDIEYKGNPQLKSFSTSGSSSIDNK